MIRESLAEVDPNTLLFILILTGILITTFMGLYVIKPSYLNFNDRSIDFEMLQSQVDDQEQLQQVIDEKRKKVRDVQLQLHGEAGDIPVNEMEAYLLGRLQGLAWDAGIELVGVRPGPAKRIMAFEEISFKVEVKGEYRNLYVWLNKIGDTLGFMLVSNYDISLAGGKTNRPSLKMHVTIVFYRALDK